MTSAELEPSGHAASVLDGMAFLYNSNILCDVTLTSHSESVHCHKLILAASSDYFKHKFVEEHDSLLDMSAFSFCTLKLVVDFIYTGRTDSLCVDNADELLTASLMFELHELVKKCTLFITSHLININTAMQYYELAINNKLTNMQEHIVKFVSINLKESLSQITDFHMLSSLLCDKVKLGIAEDESWLRFVIDWINSNKPTLHDSQCLIGQINLHNISLEYLLEVQSHSIMSNALYKQQITDAMVMVIAKMKEEFQTLTDAKELCEEENKRLNDDREQLKRWQQDAKKQTETLTGDNKKCTDKIEVNTIKYRLVSSKM